LWNAIPRLSEEKRLLREKLAISREAQTKFDKACEREIGGHSRRKIKFAEEVPKMGKDRADKIATLERRKFT
jgi:hypothetical protein